MISNTECSLQELNIENKRIRESQIVHFLHLTMSSKINELDIDEGELKKIMSKPLVKVSGFIGYAS